MSPNTSDNADFKINDSLFGVVKLTKNSHFEKYNYEGYGVCFDSRGSYIHSGNYAKNVIIFGADLKNSVHANNKANNILILGQGIVQKLNNSTIYREKELKTNCTVTSKTSVLSLHYNGNDSCLFINSVEQVKFKAADDRIRSYPVCLGNISKDFSSTNSQKTGLHGYVYDFSVDYRAITNYKIHDILI